MFSAILRIGCWVKEDETDCERRVERTHASIAFRKMLQLADEDTWKEIDAFVEYCLK